MDWIIVPGPTTIPARWDGRGEERGGGGPGILGGRGVEGVRAVECDVVVREVDLPRRSGVRRKRRGNQRSHSLVREGLVPEWPDGWQGL